MLKSGKMAWSVLAVAVALGAGPAISDTDTPKRGAVTNLPIPRFVSLKTSEGNVRRGPSLRHRIDWVYKRRGMPLEVTGEFGHWRQVRDRDGVGGWVHYSLLSGARTAIIDADLSPLFNRADDGSQINAYLEAGVIARIETCGISWCRIKADGIRGWTAKVNLWGVRESEVID